jgi:hypothetical protein
VRRRRRRRLRTCPPVTYLLASIPSPPRTASTSGRCSSGPTASRTSSPSLARS